MGGRKDFYEVRGELASLQRYPSKSTLEPLPLQSSSWESLDMDRG